MTQKSNKTKQPETFFVQNATLSYLFLSDIKLQFSRLEAKDLTWDDPNIIKKSKDLQNALRKGILVKLTEEEYNKLQDQMAEKEKKLLAREQKNKLNYKKVKSEDGEKEFIADRFDVSKSSKKQSALDFSGNANDTMSYVTAFEIAQGIAAENGDQLTAFEFGEMVENNPNLVNNLLANTRGAENQVKHRAYFSVPNGLNGDTTVGEAYLSNYNRDKRYAGLNVKDSVNLDDIDDIDDDTDYVEEIDLEQDLK